MSASLVESAARLYDIVRTDRASNLALRQLGIKTTSTKSRRPTLDGYLRDRFGEEGDSA